MINQKIEDEREQLIGHWTNAIAKQQDWTKSSQIINIFSIVNGTPSSRRSKYPIRDFLREFHNTLGYKALNGGLCAGAIFRTQSFIDTKPRIGARQGQTVHIEHTVPVCVLDTELRQCKFSDTAETLIWLLKHSVTTAFRKGDEAKYLKKVEKTTNALDRHSVEWNKPFLRYKQLLSSGGIIWNVLDRQEVEAHNFTFDDHMHLIVRLLNHAHAERSFINLIERHCGG